MIWRRVWAESPEWWGEKGRGRGGEEAQQSQCLAEANIPESSEAWCRERLKEAAAPVCSRQHEQDLMTPGEDQVCTSGTRKAGALKGENIKIGGSLWKWSYSNFTVYIDFIYMRYCLCRVRASEGLNLLYNYTHFQKWFLHLWESKLNMQRSAGDVTI